MASVPTPGSRYLQLCETGALQPEPLQQHAVDALTDLQRQLLQPPRRWWLSRQPAPPGLYLWGPVGRGKTMLMDLFCESLPPASVMRLHFHRFMRQVHQQLMDASGQPDPLAHVADGFARQARVLCFDEFYVDNIGDAMLLGRLLHHLFERQITLVTTSNQPPAGLYPDGLHRDRFLPAIQLLEQKLNVLPLNGPEDHRLRSLTPQKSWFSNLESIFDHTESKIAADNIELCNRTLSCRTFKTNQHEVIFSFHELCSGFRSAMDYIELAERYDQIWLTDIPCFYGDRREQIKARGTEDGAIANSTGERQVHWSEMDDPARRFISLIDELYDRRVNLIAFAEAPADQLYPADGALNFQFQRTLSRLVEMGSLDYQQSPAIRD